jgi:heat shock protein HslJ
VTVARRVFVVRQITDAGTVLTVVGHPTLRFADTSFSMDTGCNTVGGRYRLAGAVLVTSELGGTAMGCLGALMRQEHALMQTIVSPAQVRLTGKDLTITRRGSTIVADAAA